MHFTIRSRHDGCCNCTAKMHQSCIKVASKLRQSCSTPACTYYPRAEEIDIEIEKENKEKGRLACVLTTRSLMHMTPP